MNTAFSYVLATLNNKHVTGTLSLLLNDISQYLIHRDCKQNILESISNFLSLLHPTEDF